VPDRDGYGWANVQFLTPAQSLLNAESYAYFGLLARLGDRGFKLVSDAGAVAGKLEYNPVDIPTKVKRKIKLWKG
jgi:hypothetical protein